MQPPLDLVLMWHMHQPDYRDYSTGEFTQPWVYLHAIKDYSDMAWHLERHPGIHAVVNFVPVLLDQLEDYCDQFEHGKLRDPMLRLLARDDAQPLAYAERMLALERCFHGNHQKLIAPFPAYRRLHELFLTLEAQGSEAFTYLSDQYIYDLVTWHYLSWTGESVRRDSAVVARLMALGGKFSLRDRVEFFETLADLVRQVIPRFRRLAASGQVELSTTPQHHPLAPLLLDFRSALDAEPEMALPDATGYPGGRARVAAQLEAAQQCHARRFGAPARGVWPAEGGISAAFLGLLDASGVSWTASGEAVLANSLRRGSSPLRERGEYLYRPYRVKRGQQKLTCFFRDDRLSDLIGFEYRKWHGRDAAANFIGELEAIAGRAKYRPVVSVILDGENAWEYYPYNGYYFLSDLYESLGKHPTIRTTTFGAYLDQASEDSPAGAAADELAILVAGSWVYGNFSTWMGSSEKNHAWSLLCAAKTSFDRVVDSGRLDERQREAAMRQLSDCESSDWFWWPGEYNPKEAVAAFEQLYRAKLANLYRILALPVPANLLVPFSHGAGLPEAGGAMRRAN